MSHFYKAYDLCRQLHVANVFNDIYRALQLQAISNSFFHFQQQVRTLPQMQELVLSVILIALTQGLKSLSFGSVEGVPYMLNFSSVEGGLCWGSFECDIINYLCEYMKPSLQDTNSCTLTIMDSLDDRLTKLENYEVDIVVSRFRVTDEREERVNFVRPYYYSAGAQLFVLPEDIDIFSSFDQLETFSVCMDVGYYAAETLQKEYGLYIFPASQETMAELVEQDYCIAAITDSTFIIDGLVQAKVDPLYDLPYGVAIAKDPKIPNLYNMTQRALVELFVRGENNISLIETWENKYLLSSGISSNIKLSELTHSISLQGQYIGEVAEDEIWSAISLNSSQNLAESLQVIIPKNLEYCDLAINNIYDSYVNGTPINSLPMKVRDELVYTFVTNVTSYESLLDNFIVLQHPFLNYGVTAPEIAVSNPQFLTIIAAIQDQVNVVDARKDGEVYYYSGPFDALPVFQGNFSTWQQLQSPTRVIKTLVAKTMHGRRDEYGQLFGVNCGVGEISDW